MFRTGGTNLSVVKPKVANNGIRIKTRNCTECDYYVQGTDQCKKKGHIRLNCIDGVKTIQSKV